MSNHLTRPPNIESRLHGPSDRPCPTSLSAMLPCTSQTQSPTPRTRILSSTQDDVVIEIPSPRSTHPNHQHSQTQPPTIPRPWQTSQACRQPRNQTPKPEKKTPSTARTALPASPRYTRFANHRPRKSAIPRTYNGTNENPRTPACRVSLLPSGVLTSSNRAIVSTPACVQGVAFASAQHSTAQFP